MWEFLTTCSIIERARWILKNPVIIESLATPEDRDWLKDWATGVHRFIYSLQEEYDSTQGVAGA